MIKADRWYCPTFYWLETSCNTYIRYPLEWGGRLDFCITNKGRALLQ